MQVVILANVLQKISLFNTPIYIYYTYCFSQLPVMVSQYERLIRIQVCAVCSCTIFTKDIFDPFGITYE